MFARPLVKVTVGTVWFYTVILHVLSYCIATQLLFYLTMYCPLWLKPHLLEEREKPKNPSIYPSRVLPGSFTIALIQSVAGATAASIDIDLCFRLMLVMLSSCPKKPLRIDSFLMPLTCFPMLRLRYDAYSSSLDTNHLLSPTCSLSLSHCVSALLSWLVGVLFLEKTSTLHHHHHN